MDFLINTSELAALCELPHLQQLAYLRGIKPYMDFKTGIVGIKRKISHQSIAEQLYIAPHQGIKCVKVTKAQVRRALFNLERLGLIAIESDGMQLILKCLLAHTDFSVSKKVITPLACKADTVDNLQHDENNHDLEREDQKAITCKTAKVITPPNIRKSLVFSSSQNFENFWSLYPEKKSKAQALTAFEALNPDDALMTEIITGLTRQIEHRNSVVVQNQWVANWKNPANWLTQRCWEDEINTENKDLSHAITRPSPRKQSGSDFSWFPEESDEIASERAGNVFTFNR